MRKNTSSYHSSTHQGDKQLFPEDFDISFFYLFFDQNPAALLLTTYDKGQIISANNAFLMFMGYQAKELVGKTSTELHLFSSPEDRNQAMLIKDKSDQQYIDLQFPHKNGQLIPVQLIPKYLIIKDKEYILSTVVDLRPRIAKEQQQAYQAHILQNIADALIAISADSPFYITEWNHSAKHIFGWAKEEVLNKPVIQVLAPQESDAWKIEATLRSNSIFSGEIILQTRDGFPVWGEVKISPLKNKGKIKAWVIVSRDITHRKQMEKDLEVYRTQLEDLVSKRTKELEIYRNRLEDLVKQRTQELEIVNEQLQIEIIERRKAQEKISEHLLKIRQQNEKLKSTQQTLYTALNKNNAIIYVSDLKTYKILFANQTAKDTFGPLEGRVCWEAITKSQSNSCEHCPGFKYNIKKEKLNESYQWEYLNPYNERWYECNDTIIEWTDGRLVRLILSTDITQRKKSENQLKTLNATKDKFFSILAHDLRNPFHILTYLSSNLLKESDTITPKELQKNLQEIYLASQKGYTLLENLLTWSRSQSGLLKFQAQNLNIDSIIQTTVELFQDSAKQKQIDLITELPGNKNIKVEGDRMMLETVLRNLLSNALKFTVRQGKVKIGVLISEVIDDQSLEKITVYVSDTGVGISRQQQEKLFKIDQPLSTYGTEREAGSGLGLILCKEFVDQHNSRIEVQSGEGQGSTFSFKLPFRGFGKRRKTYKNRPSQTASSFVSKSVIPLRILVAEDNAVIREIILNTLEQQFPKASVESAEDGLLAKEKVDNFDFDLILMDIEMPGMNGLELTRYVKQELGDKKETPILGVTAYSQEESLDKCLEAGMDAVLQKPFKPDSLFDHIINLLQLSGISEKNVKSLPVTETQKTKEEPTDYQYIDLSYLPDIYQKDPNKKKKILKMCQKSIPADLVALQELYEKGNLAKLKSRAHALKSVMYHLGLIKFRDSLQEIENNAKFGQKTSAIPQQLESIVDLWPTMEKEINKAIDHLNT